MNPVFPDILSRQVIVVTSACPLEPRQRIEYEAQGFTFPASLSRAVEKRQEEFRAGRYCARQALADLGHAEAAPLVIRSDYAPEWPGGFVGSIAHSHDRAAAAAARASEIRAVGIDMEPVLSETRAANVRRMILTGQDEKTVSSLEGWSECERVTLVFCAKEAIYKCLRPLCGQYFGFEDAALDRLEENGTFHFHLNKKIGETFEAGWIGQGRFARGDGWIHAAMELPSRK